MAAMEQGRAVPGAPPADAAEAAGAPAAEAALPPLPRAPEGAVTIDDLLRFSVEVKASDLHVKVGSPPTVRVSGHLQPVEYHVMGPEECSDMAHAMLGDKETAILTDQGEVDFAYSLPSVSRFRVNIHRQRGTLGIAARRILPGAPDLKDL
ncbi:MAG TPA: hypothetical protein VHK89_10010, partial [Actinomycetota bacterium]|nr:hypothetical protein [Actinomycetota bacterium]